jgi:hypothetical protein
MGAMLICDLCRKSAPAVTFGNDGVGSNSVRDTPIQFNGANGVAHKIHLCVELRHTKPVADLCDSCIEEAITKGLQDILAVRDQAKRGVLVIGRAAQEQLKRAN